MIISVIFFLSASMVFVIGVISPILEEIGRSENLISSKTTFYTAESGVEDAVYRLKNGLAISTPEMITLNNATASTTVNTISNGKQILSSGTVGDMYRNAAVTLNNGVGIAFFYGVQVGAGGITLNNSSSIVGSVYSNGRVVGSGGNLIKGDVISAGAGGVAQNIHATGTVRAHTIQNVWAEKDAYYQNIYTSSVSGTLYPGSADQPAIDLPITDTQITDWETAAAAGTAISSPCPYDKSSGTVTLGPAVINCDLNLSNSATLVLTGPVWVKGSISIANSAIVKVSDTLGSQSAPLIAHDPANTSSGSKITISNSSSFQGSGDINSYVLLVSQNNSAEQMGGYKAITISNNNVSGQILLYAGHGEIELSNSANVREVTAYKMTLNNSAQVNYQTGLANLLFSSGPSGGYTIGSWKEGQ